MIFMERLKHIRERAEGMSMKNLESLRYLLFFILMVDMFGIYWYLKWKSLGIALLLVLVVIITMVFILERKKQDNHKQKGGTNKMDREEKQETEEKEDKKEEQEEDSGWMGEMDLGLPSSDEYNKRLEKALTGGLNFSF